LARREHEKGDRWQTVLESIWKRHNPSGQKSEHDDRNPRITLFMKSPLSLRKRQSGAWSSIRERGGRESPTWGQIGIVHMGTQPLRAAKKGRVKSNRGVIIVDRDEEAAEPQTRRQCMDWDGEETRPIEFPAASRQRLLNRTLLGLGVSFQNKGARR